MAIETCDVLVIGGGPAGFTAMVLLEGAQAIEGCRVAGKNIAEVQ